MKRTKYILIVFFIFIFILGLYKPVPAEKTEYLMDTIITISAYGTGAKKATELAFSEIERIDGLLNAFDENSEISKINQNAPYGFYKTTPEVYELIKKAVYISEKTSGAFDITLLPISSLWQIGSESPKVPEANEIKNALFSVGYKNIIFDDESHSIKFAVSGMGIDLGGIAKGYASEKATNILKENGIKNAILDLGGNISVIGRQPLDLVSAVKSGSFYRPFNVGIQDPDGVRGSYKHVYTAESDCFIITSGSYERNFSKDGILYHHIIDPKTGYPALSGVKSATIITDDGTTGDALSTAAFVLGEDSKELILGLCNKVIYIK